MRPCLLVLAGLGLLSVPTGCKPRDEQAAHKAAPPPPLVLVQQVEQRDVPLVTEYVGSLDGFINAEIRARVPGYLEHQHYNEGAEVKEGQLLFTIEPKQYEAAMEEAQAALARAQANLHNAHVTVRRLRPLAKKQAVSRQDLDDAIAGELESKAQVASAKAGIDQAELNLSYTRVLSPIPGIAGIAAVRMGNLVGQGQPTLLTTVSQVDPIRLEFSITERDYLKNLEQGSDGGVSNAPTTWVARLLLADGTEYEAPGKILHVSREVDPNTGTLRLEALFPNPHQVLRPGQFGRVRLHTQTLRQALVVPQRAVMPMQSSNLVGVVGQDSVLHLRPVKLGPAVTGSQVISSGLKPGDQVVVEGLQKAKDGQKVQAQQAPPMAAQAEDGDGGTGVGGSGSGSSSDGGSGP